jgi:ABC-type multidrug transport system permease subunit
MLHVLLAKDLRRARRNPVPYLIHLCVPLVITALLGLVFAGGGSSALGKIKFAVVDEDQSAVTKFLRGGLNQGQAGEHLEPVFLDREAALREVTNNVLSAAFIIPKGFTADFLSGSRRVKLELIKNPAQQFHPAILEELLGALVTGLNALSRNFGDDLAAWRQIITATNAPALREVGELLTVTGKRFDALRHRLDPVPVTYEKETRAGAATGGGGKSNSAGSLFAFLLPGLAAMFLLFLADVAMRDLPREMRLHTFDRMRTLPTRLSVFLTAKVLFALLITALCAAILLGGGALVFRFHWERPGAVAILALAYGVFAGGLMALLTGLWPGEKKADVLNNLVAMGLGLAGGCAFPAQALPPLLRDHVTPLLPTNWFVEGVRVTQFGGSGNWGVTALKLALLGGLLLALGAWLLRRKLEAGVRA